MIITINNNNNDNNRYLEWLVKRCRCRKDAGAEKMYFNRRNFCERNFCEKFLSLSKTSIRARVLGKRVNRGASYGLEKFLYALFFKAMSREQHG